MNEEQIQTPPNLGITKPCKTWFMERGDGFIFACDELEAWNLLNNQSNWARRDFKVVGTSDGKTYFDIIQNGKVKVPAILAEMNKLKFDYKRYTDTEDKLRFEELLTDEDDKIKKVKEIRENLQSKISEKEKELKAITEDITKTAFEAELEIAKKTPERPRNMDIVSPVESDRDRIAKLIL